MKVLTLSFILFFLTSMNVFAGGPIIPGKSLGEIVLGVTLCKKVKEATYNFTVTTECVDGYVSRAETPTGGTVWMEDPIIINGITSAPKIIHEFGGLFEVSVDAEYEVSIAYWLTYQEKGVAFRIIYFDKGEINLESSRSIVQSIAVFTPKK